MRFYFIFFCLSIFFACNNNNPTLHTEQHVKFRFTYKTKINYAKGFQIQYLSDSIAQATIFFLPDTINPISTYNFSGCNTCIKLPVYSFAINSTTWLPYFSMLEADTCIKGFSGLNYITDSLYRNKIENKKLIEISNGKEIDAEKLISLSPQVMMTYPFQGDKYPDVSKYGIVHIYNADYLENTPLARTEWIKFIALLLGREAMADSLFQLIEANYHLIKQTAQKQINKPSVFTNKPHKGVWYVQGANSYAANFIKDAGGEYIFADSNINNVYPMDFEYVFNRAINADIWLIISHEKPDYSLNDLLNEDHRYKYFKAVKTGRVIHCNTSQNQYFEKSSAQPDVVLKDLVYFFYPEVFTDYKPVFFKKLN
jgi:iron complex transport system substrate-binding protein